MHPHTNRFGFSFLTFSIDENLRVSFEDNLSNRQSFKKSYISQNVSQMTQQNHKIQCQVKFQFNLISIFDFKHYSIKPLAPPGEICDLQNDRSFYIFFLTLNRLNCLWTFPFCWIHVELSLFFSSPLIATFSEVLVLG